MSIAQAASRHLSHWWFAHRAAKALELAETVNRATPSYEKMFTAGKKLNLALAARHLVGWPNKKALNEGATELQLVLRELGVLQVSLDWPSISLEMDTEKVDAIVETASWHYNVARDALSTIVGVNCLQNQKGQGQSSSATRILAGGGSPPDIIKKMLDMAKEA